MKYHMRRGERSLNEWSVYEEILLAGKYATIALAWNNEPYVVTLSYGYDRIERSLYFHCAKHGLKTELIRCNPNACLTIVEDKGYIQNECAHSYRSLVIRGKIQVITDDSRKQKGVDVLINHLERSPEVMKMKLPQKKATFDSMNIWKLTVDEISGKGGQ